MGAGIEQDAKQAFHWYHKAAKQGDASAQFNLGYCYYYGVGVAQNEEQSIDWLRQAAVNGDTDAQEILQEFGVEW